MSHIVTISVEVRDLDAVRAACDRLQLNEPVYGKTTLFQTEVEGYLVSLENWLYPVVCDLESGVIHYDNFNGTWGDPKQLDRFVQAYSVEKTTLEARRKGYSVMEHLLSDGSVKLTIGGVA